MKYLIWRHENALGNSAEQTVGLAKYLKANPDPEAIVYVENYFQQHFALCIPGVEQIKKLDAALCDTSNLESILQVPEYADIHIPSVYYRGGDQRKYPGSWSELKGMPERALFFPFHDSYITEEKINNLPKEPILIQIREKGTFYKRVDGADAEPLRFVNPETYFKVALHYANLGYQVVRIGDKNQTPMLIMPCTCYLLLGLF